MQLCEGCNTMQAQLHSLCAPPGLLIPHHRHLTPHHSPAAYLNIYFIPQPPSYPTLPPHTSPFPCCLRASASTSYLNIYFIPQHLLHTPPTLLTPHQSPPAYLNIYFIPQPASNPTQTPHTSPCEIEICSGAFWRKFLRCIKELLLTPRARFG